MVRSMLSGVRRVMLLPIAAALGVVAAGCGGGDGAGDPGESGAQAGLSIVTTTGMIADTARAVAGDRATVVSLTGPGVDPHLYAPTRSDVQRIDAADVVFSNGLALEARLAESLGRAAESGKPVIAVGGALDESRLLMAEGEADEIDPHVWNDPDLWADVVGVIADTLSEVDPDGAETYAANAAAYAVELAELSEYADRVLETVSEDARVLVTAHDAFAYFGERFGYAVEGVQGVSTESEAGIADIERLVSLIVDRGIQAVFIESSVAAKNVEALTNGARARGQDVIIGGELFSDTMGDEGTYEGTYIGMVDHNVTTVARALGGEAPAGGLNGKLGGAAGDESEGEAAEPAGSVN